MLYALFCIVHASILMSMHHCIRIVTEEGVKIEAAADEPVPEATPSSDNCPAAFEPALFALQGKPRCI